MAHNLSIMGLSHCARNHALKMCLWKANLVGFRPPGFAIIFDFHAMSSHKPVAVHTP